jgi:hypothetical protein
MVRSTLAISVHTFVVIFFSWHPPTGAQGARIWGAVIASIWLYLGLCVSVGGCQYLTAHRAWLTGALGFAVHQGRADRKHGVDIALEDFYVPTP